MQKKDYKTKILMLALGAILLFFFSNDFGLIDIEKTAIITAVAIDMEEDDNTTLFIVDVPIIEKESNEQVYSTMPLGMIFVRDDYFITVSLKRNKVIDAFEKNKIRGFYTYKKTRFLLQILYNVCI